MEELLHPTSFDWQALVSKLSDISVTFGTKLLAAIVVFLIGRWIVRRIDKLITGIMQRRHVEASLFSFLKSLVSITLNFVLIIIIISILGIETSSFIALFASAGVAIGMALSGTLQNFAGGVMILLFKPFRVGDFIEAQGQSGTVKEIQIFNTIIATGDNKTIIIPNGGLSTGTMTNYSKADTRRVDWTFAIAYGENYDKAKEIIGKLVKEDARVPLPLNGSRITSFFFIPENSIAFSTKLSVLSMSRYSFNCFEPSSARLSVCEIRLLPFFDFPIHLSSIKADLFASVHFTLISTGLEAPKLYSRTTSTPRKALDKNSFKDFCICSSGAGLKNIRLLSNQHSLNSAQFEVDIFSVLYCNNA